MSDSYRLSETRTGSQINNTESVKVEKKVIAANEIAMDKIKIQYPNGKFLWETKLYKSDIHKKLRGSLKEENIGCNLTINNSYIKPDGGLFYLLYNDSKNLLGAVEAKKQGTNDIRKLDGKDKQSKGNAIERASKNYIELSNYLIDQEIFPYLIFMNGCDLEDSDSSIRDRVTNMNKGSPFNNLYVNNLKDINNNQHIRASIFIGIDNIEAMSDIILDMYNLSIKYYLNKLQTEFVGIN